MMAKKALWIVAALVLCAGGCGQMNHDTLKNKEPQLVHAVYFTLNDAAPAQKKNLVAECYSYLREHPGVEYFAAGPRDETLTRPVNVADYDVCLLVVFANRQFHDVYQTAPRHKEFIERNQGNWKQVRVFDSLVE